MNTPVRLLLIDDNPDDRALALRELERALPAVHAVPILNDRDFQQALAGESFDLVITDYQLNWSTGLAVLRSVKERFPDCPVVMFTGTGSQEIAVEAMKAGLDDYVIKSPAHYIRLPLAVGAGLERAGQRRELRQAERLRRELEEELRRRVEALAAADRQKNQFLAMLAHELRNPLAPILSAVELQRRSPVHDPVILRTREIIARQAQHLAHMMDDLLDVARITSGRIELRRSPVDLTSVVADAVETTSFLFEARGHQLSVTLPHEPIRLPADPTRLTQILVNLLSNAARYTEPGGQVWLSAEREPGMVVLCVRDNGAGIAPDLLPHIFDLFHQGGHGPDRSHGGLGIGLTLVKQLTELHGGSVEAHSAGPGRGTEFAVRLPDHLDAQASPPEAATAAGEGPAASLRVMVVDDNVDAADTLGALLEVWGYEVEILHDSPAAVEHASRFDPDVVLLDLNMPQMSGFEVARALRSQPGLAPTQLIAVTGYGQDEDRQQTRAAGFYAHLTKPVDPHRLQQLLAELTQKPPH